MSIEDQIAALESMPTPALAARYEELYGKPPRCRHRRWLQKRIAHRIQEIKFGGLSVTARARLESLIAELDLPLGREDKPQHKRGDGAPTPGTTLVREWRGRQIRVRVMGRNDFEWNGQRFRSLTAVVRAATGMHASGPQWFGLVKARVRA